LVLVINYATTSSLSSIISVVTSSTFTSGVVSTGASSVLTSSVFTSGVVSTGVSTFTSSIFSSTLGSTFLTEGALHRFAFPSSVSFLAAASKNLARAETGDIILHTSLPSNTSLLGIAAIIAVSLESFILHSKYDQAHTILGFLAKPFINSFTFHKAETASSFEQTTAI
jgi:hypothetical protein